MKRIIAAFCFMAWSSSAFAGVVDDAKQQIAKEKQATLVSKAKFLLEEKTRLETKLEAVKKKLLKLDDGEDVDVSEPATSGYITINGSTTTYPTFRALVGN